VESIRLVDLVVAVLGTGTLRAAALAGPLARALGSALGLPLGLSTAFGFAIVCISA
jgi:hypothetical protein